jgi:acetylglutamate synthase
MARRTVMLVRLIEMIENDAASMAKELKGKLLSDPNTSSYQTLADQTLYQNIFEIYSRLGHWLLRDTEKGEVKTHYSSIGRQRFEEGFPLHEIVQALVATKRHIWDTVLEKGIMRTTRELDSAVDFITYLNRFFDMAIYYTTLGYYRELQLQKAS